jgi:Ca-activated chloride channel family protein
VRLRWLPAALRACAIALLVVAVARPQRGLATTFVPEQGIDIVLALDISGSMEQPTALPNGRPGPTRLAAARTVLQDFVRSLDGHRVGLVIFKSRSLVMSPLTVDRIAMERTVSTLQTDILPDGTAIGLGLAESLNLLRGSDAHSRVVVLLTDGENNAGEITPSQAGQLAKTLGVRVYTIGLIASRGAPGVDEETLRRIASETGGTYSSAATQAELAQTYETIGALERSRVGERRFTRFQEFAPWVAGFALALLVAEAALRATALRRYP